MLAAASGLPRRRVDEVLAMVGLSAVGRKRPRTFSLGMNQRLGLAAALLGDPHTLILDEPANGLDPHGIQWLRGLLRSLAAEGRTVFVSSHQLSEMELMADELVVMGRGRLLASGSVVSFVRDFTRTTTVVRSPQIDTLVKAVAARVPTVQISREPDHAALLVGVETGQVGEIAAAEGVSLHELTTRTASLEEAFFEATGSSEEYVGRLQPVPEVTGGRS
jgi:ABC-2 type transport system ATP-binding protein